MVLKDNLPPKGPAQTPEVNIIAFGFKHGVPRELDLLFDVRFLRNPNYVPELEPLTGAAKPVAEYIEADPSTKPFLERLFALLDFVIPRYLDESRKTITIGIGCTGGRHRSVYIAGRLLGHLQKTDRRVRLLERDTVK